MEQPTAEGALKNDRGVCRVYERSIGDGTTIVGRWEKTGDGTNYETDFDLTYTRLGV